MQVTHYPLCALTASGNTYMCVSHHSGQQQGPDLLSVLPTIFSASLSFDEMPASLVGPQLGDSGGQDGFPSVLEHCSWLLYMGVGQAHSCLSLLAAVASPAFIPARQSCSSTATYTTHREELAYQLISLSQFNEFCKTDSIHATQFSIFFTVVYFLPNYE